MLFRSVERIANPPQPILLKMPETLGSIVKQRVQYLTDYQNADYARQYQSIVDQVRTAEAALGQGDRLARTVAKSLFKLMAYKDEYEVARLYTTASFADKLKQQFEGKLKLRLNLAPPLFAKKDAHGYPLKTEYGSWVWPLLRLLARSKSLRGTKLDPFGWTEERRLERQLIVDYRALIMNLLERLDAHRLPQAVEIAALAEKIRGFGHVKIQAIKRYQADLESALQRLQSEDSSVNNHANNNKDNVLGNAA